MDSHYYLHSVDDWLSNGWCKGKYINSIYLPCVSPSSSSFMFSGYAFAFQPSACRANTLTVLSAHNCRTDERLTCVNCHDRTECWTPWRYVNDHRRHISLTKPYFLHEHKNDIFKHKLVSWSKVKRYRWKGPSHLQQLKPG